MIVVKGNVVSRGMTFRIAQREFNDIKRGAIAETAEHHHTHNIPRRFTYEGQRRFGFGERSAKYTRYKAKRYGHVNPNVLTGASRDAALREPRIKATATSKRAVARLVMNAPNLNFRNPNSPNRIHPAAEVRKIYSSEEQQLTEVFGNAVHRRLNARQGETV